LTSTHHPAPPTQLRAVLTPDATAGFDDVCRFRTIGPGDTFDIGRLSFELFESSHPVPTVSARVTCDQKVAVYSSDSTGGPGLVRAASHADLFLCEATWESGDAHVASGGHMSAGQAGAVAQEAGVASLLLTHLRPGNDPKRAIAEAQRFFAGPVDVATDGEVRVLA
jgi:ribonuclease BN (tRNA processing enzyme)